MSLFPTSWTNIQNELNNINKDELLIKIQTDKELQAKLEEKTDQVAAGILLNAGRGIVNIPPNKYIGNEANSGELHSFIEEQLNHMNFYEKIAGIN